MESQRRSLSPGSVLCVTDGDSAGFSDDPAVWVEWMGPAIDAGLPLLQIREPRRDAGALIAIVRALVHRAHGHHCRILVNDRLDIALAAGAHGVHLPARAPAAALVRAMMPPGFLVGRSIHAPHEAAEAGPVDYLVAGAVFGSGAKPARGLPWLADVCRASAVPVLAIGGLTPEREVVSACVAAGASGVAAITPFLPAGCRPGAIGSAAATTALIQLMAGCIHE